MKLSDYIVEYLVKNNISDVFGYPGGMVTHLIDSFRKYSNSINAHVTYHEQAAAFAACGYAQSSGNVGVAYATSGPGATNLITGIANAYFDSIPVLFITGQVNTNESKGNLGVRQRGFQETDVIEIVKPITKGAYYVESADKIKYYLDLAFNTALEARKGPVLLDIPMNIFRTDVEPDTLVGLDKALTSQIQSNDLDAQVLDEACKTVVDALNASSRPCFILGNGIKASHDFSMLQTFIYENNIPVVTSMLAFDIMSDYQHKYGFIGAYGDRTANFIVAKSDLIITIGTRLDIRQVGAVRDNFARNSRIIRFDIDKGELEYKVHEDETQYVMDICDIVKLFASVKVQNDFTEWISVCDRLRTELQGIDDNTERSVMRHISRFIPDNTVITTDVGQNQVWVAQEFELKHRQKVLFSGGHGAMGYSFPAAIGAYYGTNRPVVSINGDGGFQMNIQELQFIARERIPVKIIVFNNDALGMIRHFQEMYFDSNYFQTKPEGGYSSPCFVDVAKAYGIESYIYNPDSPLDDDIMNEIFNSYKPILLEVALSQDTYVFPKLEFGKPNQDQEPLIDRKMYDSLMEL